MPGTGTGDKSAVHTRESTVELLMTRSPLVVWEGDAIAAVAEVLAEFKLSGLPVVDAEDHLVGVISETDLVRLRGSRLPWKAWHGLMVRDVMSTPAKTIPATSPVAAAARQMTAEGVSRLIVVDDLIRPIGVISESDLVREIAASSDD
jgi:CBS domain-containing protein